MTGVFGRLALGIAGFSTATPTPSPTPAPVFTTGPSIASDGTPQVGETLTGSDGTITNGTVSARQWLLAGSAISGATGASYVPTATGSHTYRVTAAGTGGSTSATSAAVTVAAAPAPTPTPSVTWLRNITAPRVIALSTHRLRPTSDGYNGPMLQLTRDGGGTLDITSDTTGQAPDQSGFAAFATAGVHPLRYDQTGNGKHEIVPSGLDAPSYFGPTIGGRANLDGLPGSTYTTTNAGTTTPLDYALSRQAVTLFMVACGNGYDQGLGGLAPGGDTFSGAQIVMDNNRLTVLGNSFAQFPLLRPAVPDVICLRLGAGSGSLRVGKRVATFGGFAAATIPGVYFGKGAFRAGAFQEHRTVLVYGADIGSTDEANIVADLRAIHGIPDYQHQVICDGDSTQFGQGSVTGRSPAQWMAASLDAPCWIANVGQSGNTIGGLRDLSPHYDATAFPGKQIAILGIGTNDIDAGTSAADIYAAMVAWKNARLSDGYEPILRTVPPTTAFTSGNGKEAVRTSLNTMITGGASSGGYRVVNLGTISQLADPTNGTYYADGKHFTDAGSQLVGDAYAVQANAILAVATPAPAFTVNPSITTDGTPQIGETLTGNDGTSTHTTSRARQWLLNGSAISGATGATYVPDATGSLTYRVAATGAGGTTTVTSTAVTVAAAPAPTPTPSSFIDTFGSTAGDLYGRGGWTDVDSAGLFTIPSGGGRVDVAGTGLAGGDAGSNRQWLEITAVNDVKKFRLIMGLTSAHSHSIQIRGQNGADINYDGVNIASIGGVYMFGGQTLRFELDPPAGTLTIYRNGTQIGQATNIPTSMTGTRLGFYQDDFPDAQSFSRVAWGAL